MTTWTALTTLAHPAPAHALAGMMEQVLDPAPSGIGCFEIEDGSGRWEVGGYFERKPDEAALALLAVLHDAAPFTVSRLDDRDWVAQVRRELHPIEAGRFTVHGAHDAHRVGPHRIGLSIEAAMAFGTGHHATTQACLRLIDLLARGGVAGPGWRPRRVADIGTGTGVLAMAAARRWHVRVLAGDLDPVAAETARVNARHNRVGLTMQAFVAAGLAHPRLRREAPYDLILANILAAPLRRLAPAMRAHLAPGGYAVLSGLLSVQAPAVEAVYRGHGLRRVRRLVIGTWTSLMLQRPR
ncbi:MAG: 50S ribosomal protein L11 methyltransferase [Pseudomonadota bacterium]